MFLYVPINVYNHIEKNSGKKKKDKTFEKHDPKWQQSLGSMRLGGRDGLLTTYTSVV